MFNIVLVEPEIPNNTGNIGRTCVATSSQLHLIEPLGFQINDKNLKRAGLDYWEHLVWTKYSDLLSFQKQHSTSRSVYFSAHGQRPYYEHEFKKGDFLFFGKETKGLDPEILYANRENTFYIPTSDNVRSLNLATAVAIVAYEGIRQLSVSSSVLC